MPPQVSSAMTLKRIHREVADVAREDLGAITLAPTDSLFIWKGSIPGPAGSPYEMGVFGVDVVLGTDYPIYHMNVSDRGQICMDILKNNWSPALSLFKVMLSLSSLLTDPNPLPSIATEYIRNRAQHDKTARHWTSLYAKPPAPIPASAPASSSSAASPTQPATTSGSSTVLTGKNKGKEKASPLPPTTSRAARQNGRAIENSTIVIDSDSDTGSEPAPRVQGKRQKRKLVDSSGDGEVVDLTGLDTEGNGEPRAKRRGVVGAGGIVSGPMGGGGSGEVIVIDD
ncbi:hypothetical protein HWV62_16750 [Athelia sp. TMB]|nr:hypothetical protein HWV62_16750 [Athelia sp. TMB]